MMDDDRTLKRSAIMRTVKAKDTGPELTVRQLVHSLGYRYRLHAKDLPGKPDLVFRSRCKVVFVNGCFWHGHTCKRGNRLPKTNRAYWKTKIEKNVARDQKHYSELRRTGWTVMTIWECELSDLSGLKIAIRDFLD